MNKNSVSVREECFSQSGDSVVGLMKLVLWTWTLCPTGDARGKVGGQEDHEP